MSYLQPIVDVVLAGLGGAALLVALKVKKFLFNHMRDINARCTEMDLRHLGMYSEYTKIASQSTQNSSHIVCSNCHLTVAKYNPQTGICANCDYNGYIKAVTE